jgi:hypothetical protein
MIEQLLIAYVAGMILAVAIEVGRVLKARRLNRKAVEAGIIATGSAPAIRTPLPMVNAGAPRTAANEAHAPALMQAAG